MTRACKWVFTRAWLFLLWIAAIVGLASSDKEKSDEDNTPDALSPMGSPTPVDEMFSGQPHKWRLFLLTYPLGMRLLCKHCFRHSLLVLRKSIMPAYFVNFLSLIGGCPFNLTFREEAIMRAFA